MEEGGLQDFNYTIFPCLNPRGMLERRREIPEGKDLNRDYFIAPPSRFNDSLKRLIHGTLTWLFPA